MSKFTEKGGGMPMQRKRIIAFSVQEAGYGQNA